MGGLSLNKLNIGLLFGGCSPEHEVSLSTATSILKNIDRSRFDVFPVGITREGKWFLYTGSIEEIQSDCWTGGDCTPALLSPARGDGLIVFKENGILRIPMDCIFPALHGINGEDGSIQGLCQVAGIPCVGPMVTASAVSMDKSVTKSVVRETGIRQAEYVLVLKRAYLESPETVRNQVEQKLSYPVFVKPASTGSSVGISKVKRAERLFSAIEEALKYSDRVLVEEFFDGREIEVAILGNDDPMVSLPGEIVPGDEFYSYNDKYLDGVAALHLPANLPQEISDQIRESAKRIYQTIGCTGLSRVDFFVHKVTGEVCFNEINTLPGFTSISMYPKLFIHQGIPYPDLITRLIKLALQADQR